MTPKASGDRFDRHPDERRGRGCCRRMRQPPQQPSEPQVSHYPSSRVVHERCIRASSERKMYERKYILAKGRYFSPIFLSRGHRDGRVCGHREEEEEEKTHDRKSIFDRLFFYFLSSSSISSWQSRRNRKEKRNKKISKLISYFLFFLFSFFLPFPIAHRRWRKRRKGRDWSPKKDEKSEANFLFLVGSKSLPPCPFLFLLQEKEGTWAWK